MKQYFSFQSVLMIAMFLALAPNFVSAQQALTWDQVKVLFEATNPTLKADAANVEEMKAEEITAFLRPNPQVGLLADGTQIVPHAGVWTPFKGTYEQPSISYLHEREHKRELRLQSAKEGTQITESQHIDLERNLIFGLRSAFVQTLQAKAVLQLAKADLEYAHVSMPATWPRSTWPASSFSECNTNQNSKLRSSICAPRKSRYCCCSTIAHLSTNSM